MVWGVANTLLPLIEPEVFGDLAAFSNIIKYIDVSKKCFNCQFQQITTLNFSLIDLKGSWSKGADYDRASDCVKRMVNDAINGSVYRYHQFT